MTDRHRAIVVMLEESVRSDDLQSTIDAIYMIRGVAAAVGVESVDVGERYAKRAEVVMDAVRWHRAQAEALLGEAFER